MLNKITPNLVEVKIANVRLWYSFNYIIAYEIEGKPINISDGRVTRAQTHHVKIINSMNSFKKIKTISRPLFLQMLQQIEDIIRQSLNLNCTKQP